MSRISTGVGLVSGMNIQQIVDQLISVDARPRDLLQARIGVLNTQKAAFADITARITALLGRVNSFAQRQSFLSYRATSSNEDALSATVAENVQPGTYTFNVRGLATTHHLISNGFRDRDATLGTGTITIESAAARVNRAMQLSELNGGAGVQRGVVRITDASGRSAEIDVRDALTLSDVVDRINDADVAVRASIRGDALVLDETTGGQVRISDIEGGRTAADLGFSEANSVGTGRLSGARLSAMRDTTRLEALNDGLGVRRSTGGGDFRITDSAGGQIDVDLSNIITSDTRVERLNHGAGVRLGRIRLTARDGRTADVDLTGLQTVGQIKAAIDTTNIGVSVVLSGGRMLVSDSSTPATGTNRAPELAVEDLDGGVAARDLGIAGRTSTNRIDGRNVLAVDSVADVLAAINFADGNNGQVRASISADGRRIEIADTVGGTTGRLIFEAVNGSNALGDLGFEARDYGADEPAAGRRLIGGVDSALLSTLNGGRGIAAGTIRMEIGSATTDIDLSGAESLSDIINAINDASSSANLGVLAEVDHTGTRLLIRNTRDGAAVTISDVQGETAERLGIAESSSQIRGANLQRQYVNENTRLSTLNAWRGVALGTLRITNSSGAAVNISLNPESVKTLGDVMRAINNSAANVRAEINETGDGLVLIDNSGGGGVLSVSDVSGTAARDLNLTRSATAGRIDGTFEFKLDITSGQTLSDVAARISTETSIATANILNDGTSNPYRLNIVARASGSAGELILDSTSAALSFGTLTRAQDARVLVGADGATGLLVNSSTNTLANVFEGLSLDLTSVTDEPVTVTVGSDSSRVLESINSFVRDFNGLMDRIAELGDYNADTEEGGPLLGDSTLQTVESRLFRSVIQRVAGLGGQIQRLSDIGIRLNGDTRLEVDANRLNAAVTQNSEEVARFFTTTTTGMAAKLKADLESLNGGEGILKRRDRAISGQTEQMNQRIEQLNALLERKRERLTRQFLAMERALSGLQSQQSALGSLAGLVSSASR
ncbi:MAG: flagellar filament capping protein FliD [Phycisphaerales bacterium]|nr:flagellar filament capping protein FliD [Phycisphaerales bacterium]